MSNNTLYKTFTLFFSKFKCLPTITSSSDDHEQQRQHEIPNLPPIQNPSIYKNFNSLYDTNSDTISTSKSLAGADHFFSSSDNDSDDDSVPDFTSAFASHRFFFSSPGTTNSIFEPPENLPPAPAPAPAMIDGGVAFQTYSPDPYTDFRESMREMIEAREIKDVVNDWEFLHELLLCYLTLNPKHAHKFIVGAFADVVVSLLPAPDDVTFRETSRRQDCAMLLGSD